MKSSKHKYFYIQPEVNPDKFHEFFLKLSKKINCKTFGNIKMESMRIAYENHRPLVDILTSIPGEQCQYWKTRAKKGRLGIIGTYLDCGCNDSNSLYRITQDTITEFAYR